MKQLPIVIALGLCAQGIICADDKTVEFDASRYPQTEVYKEAFRGSLPDSHILEISAFAGGGGFVLEYSVSEKGQEADLRVSTMGLEAGGGKQLSSDQMKALLVAITELPSENVYGPAGYLVVVRSRKGAATVTHCYDGKNLPKAMRDIYAIIGERFETAGIK